MNVNMINNSSLVSKPYSGAIDTLKTNLVNLAVGKTVAYLYGIGSERVTDLMRQTIQENKTTLDFEALMVTEAKASNASFIRRAVARPLISVARFSTEFYVNPLWNKTVQKIESFIASSDEDKLVLFEKFLVDPLTKTVEKILEAEAKASMIDIRSKVENNAIMESFLVDHKNQEKVINKFCDLLADYIGSININQLGEAIKGEFAPKNALGRWLFGKALDMGIYFAPSQNKIDAMINGYYFQGVSLAFSAVENYFNINDEEPYCPQMMQLILSFFPQGTQNPDPSHPDQNVKATPQLPASVEPSQTSSTSESAIKLALISKLNNKLQDLGKKGLNLLDEPGSDESSVVWAQIRTAALPYASKQIVTVYQSVVLPEYLEKLLEKVAQMANTKLVTSRSREATQDEAIPLTVAQIEEIKTTLQSEVKKQIGNLPERLLSHYDISSTENRKGFRNWLKNSLALNGLGFAKTVVGGLIGDRIEKRFDQVTDRLLKIVSKTYNLRNLQQQIGYACAFGSDSEDSAFESGSDDSEDVFISLSSESEDVFSSIPNNTGYVFGSDSSNN